MMAEDKSVHVRTNLCTGPFIHPVTHLCQIIAFLSVIASQTRPTICHICNIQYSDTYVPLPPQSHVIATRSRRVTNMLQAKAARNANHWHSLPTTREKDHLPFTERSQSGNMTGAAGRY